MLETQREPVPRNDGGEFDTAVAFLRFARSSVLKKVDGLTDEQLTRRLVVSETTLLGLVRHLTDGERYWFGHVVAGDPAYADLDFGMAIEPGRPSSQIVDAYRAAIADSDAILAAAGGLEKPAAQPVDGNTHSVRWVLAHMTSETVRHAGHADILRELVDGITGR